MQIAAAILYACFFALIACKQRIETANVKMSNGFAVKKDTVETLPVVRIARKKGDNISTCTGTLLNETTILTAAHCLRENSDAFDSYNFVDPASSKNQFTVKNVFFVPEDKVAEAMRSSAAKRLGSAISSKKSESEIDAEYGNLLEQIKFSSESDLGILVVDLSKDLKGTIKKFYGISAKKTEDLKTALSVGFGRDDNEDVGNKNAGIAILDHEKDLPAGVIATRGLLKSNKNLPTGILVALKSGDSGGPLISCTDPEGEHDLDTLEALSKAKLCSAFELIGIASSASELPTWDTEINGKTYKTYRSFFTPLQSETARDFFKSAIKCKNKPCAENFQGSGVDN